MNKQFFFAIDRINKRTIYFSEIEYYLLLFALGVSVSTSIVIIIKISNKLNGRFAKKQECTLAQNTDKKKSSYWRSLIIRGGGDEDLPLEAAKLCACLQKEGVYEIINPLLKRMVSNSLALYHAKKPSILSVKLFILLAIRSLSTDEMAKTLISTNTINIRAYVSSEIILKSIMTFSAAVFMSSSVFYAAKIIIFRTAVKCTLIGSGLLAGMVIYYYTNVFDCNTFLKRYPLDYIMKDGEIHRLVKIPNVDPSLQLIDPYNYKDAIFSTQKSKDMCKIPTDEELKSFYESSGLKIPQPSAMPTPSKINRVKPEVNKTTGLQTVEPSGRLAQGNGQSAASKRHAQKMLNAKEHGYKEKEIDILCVTGEKIAPLDANKYDLDDLKKIDKDEFIQMREQMESCTNIEEEVPSSREDVYKEYVQRKMKAENDRMRMYADAAMDGLQ